MVTRFDRALIAAINSTQQAKVKTNDKTKSERIEVPHVETFKYIFDNAKKGNEYAAVLMDEWQRNCKPESDNEEHVVLLINKAAERIFK